MSSKSIKNNYTSMTTKYKKLINKRSHATILEEVSKRVPIPKTNFQFLDPLPNSGISFSDFSLAKNNPSANYFAPKAN
ncbi:hypothetical protein BB560_006373, partial [Smittium megazygosporum]